MPERIRSGPFAPNWIPPEVIDSPALTAVQILKKNTPVAHLTAGAKSKKYRINLTGSGFTPESKAIIGGTEVEIILTSSTELTARLPFKRVPDVDALDVEVRNTDGQVSNSLRIEVRR